jgi:hypothetical protein
VPSGSPRLVVSVDPRMHRKLGEATRVLAGVRTCAAQLVEAREVALRGGSVHEGLTSVRASNPVSGRFAHATVLLEEVRERGVIKQVFRFDGLIFAGNRMTKMRWHGPMTPPAGMPNTLDLAVDPQLVHDLAETFNAGVRDERAKILRFVPAIRFHSVEDEAGVFAQRMHRDVSAITAASALKCPLGLRPHSLLRMTAAWAFWSADSYGPLVAKLD